MSDEEIIDNIKKVRVDEIINNLPRENPEVLNNPNGCSTHLS